MTLFTYDPPTNLSRFPTGSIRCKRKARTGNIGAFQSIKRVSSGLRSMHIYSQKIVRFVQEVTAEVKSVLRDEVHLTVSRSVFCDRKNRYRYPISVVVFNDQSKLGYFDSEFYELGFHECLMNVSREQLKNIIRHEIAHYMIFIEFGNTVHSHGMEFRSFCRSIGWGEEVFRASTTLEVVDFVQEESRVLRKVKKLMALSSSSNSHEAEQAMVKAQQLLLSHNISSLNLDEISPDGEKMVLKRILRQGKRSAKMRAIASILGTFFVSVVFSRAGNQTHLEILGTPTNVQIAGYVSDFLQAELDSLWLKAREDYRLKGVVAKNSFYLGIAKGYCDKINRLTNAASPDITNALMVIENQIEEARKMAYSSLTNSTSQSRLCPLSSELGKQAGNSLSINPAVSSTNSGEPLLIGGP